MITHYPLEIYHSAIIFPPLNCTVRNQFWDQRPRFLKSSHISEANWHSEIAIIQSKGMLTALAFEASGSTLLSCSGHFDTGTVLIKKWDLGAGRMTSQPLPVLGLSEYGAKAVFSQDSTLLAAADEQGLWVLEISNPQQTSKRSLSGLGDIDSIACLPDGKGFATISNSKLQLWNNALEEVQPSHQFSYSMTMSKIAFTPDGRTLATAPYRPSTTIYLWDWTARIELQPLMTHVEDDAGRHWSDLSIYTIAFSQDGKTIAAAVGRKIRLWDITTRRLKYVLDYIEDGDTFPYILSFSPDGSTLAAGDSNHRILLWDISKQSESFIRMSTATGYKGPWDDVRLLDDLKTILSVNISFIDSNTTLQEWNLENGRKRVFESKLLQTLTRQDFFAFPRGHERGRFRFHVLMERYLPNILYMYENLSMPDPGLKGKKRPDPEDGGKARDIGTLSICNAEHAVAPAGFGAPPDRV
ncbi:tricorn protease domain 2-containing protein [Canariomyces notabilis]|uniref:Mitochondrial division protein 1 n=1 Tax=Canariomyces notabilis TaxID=2074819 RepID=A0AAN6QFL7_9PEZI|nr:tricorn protease domain 2-containing protein [Canariomyces arenarius]